jgi:NTP pyrophosphatase (non-canonical NTP hydrolase)
MRFRIGDLVGVRAGHKYSFRSGVVIADKGNEYVLRFLEDEMARGVVGGFTGTDLTPLIDEFREGDYFEFVRSRLKKLETTNENLLHCAVGCATEAGELLSTAKKVSFYGKPLEPAVLENIIEELGDILFYVVGACSTVGVSLARVAAENQKKLEKRYPTGYSDSDALARADKGGSDA